MCSSCNHVISKHIDKQREFYFNILMWFCHSVNPLYIFGSKGSFYNYYCFNINADFQTKTPPHI